MTLYYNTWGLPYSATSQRAVNDFESAITAYLASATDTMAQLDEILTYDATMPMVHCFRGYLLKLAAHPQFTGALQTCADQANGLLAQGVCNAREQAHVQALALWCADHTDQALSVLENSLREYPLDMLALRIAHYMHFYDGRGEAMRDSTARVLTSWPQDHEHYGYLHGMHAFGLEESGQYDEATEFGKRAVTQNPGDIWATHAVAHVYLMRNEHTEGLAWIRSLTSNFAHTNNFRYHVYWHEALHLLGLGESSLAIKFYDEHLAASVVDDFYLDLCNNAALLWRLEFLGVDVGDRWQALAACAEKHVHDRELVFASLHYLIPLVATGSIGKDELIETVRSWSQQATCQGRVCAEVGNVLAQAIVESATAPAAGASLLAANLSQTYQIGGSHAQRDLFRLLGVHSAQRVARDDLVAALNAH